jgi:hypothetical protein
MLIHWLIALLLDVALLTLSFPPAQFLTVKPLSRCLATTLAVSRAIAYRT